MDHLLLLSFLAISMISVNGQFETLSSDNEPVNELRETPSSGTSNSVLPISNPSPSDALSQLEKAQKDQGKKILAISDKLDDATSKMRENFEKTMYQLDKLNDKLGALGSLFEFLSEHGMFVILLCIALPFTLIMLQVLILFQLCRPSSKSSRCYCRPSKTVELDTV